MYIPILLEGKRLYIFLHNMPLNKKKIDARFHYARRKIASAARHFEAMKKRYYRQLAMLPESVQDLPAQLTTGKPLPALEDPEVYAATRKRLQDWYHSLPRDMVYTAEQGMRHLGMDHTGCKSDILAWALDHHRPSIYFREDGARHNESVLAVLLLARARKIADNPVSLFLVHAEVLDWKLPAEWIQWRKTITFLQNEFQIACSSW